MARTAWGAALAFSAALLALDARAASLQGTGTSRVHALSADGTTAVGDLAGPEYQPYRWTASTGALALGQLGSIGDGGAFGVSADGAIVVGMSTTDAGHNEAFRWTASTGIVGLGVPSAAFPESGAYELSRDGSVAVGTAFWVVPGFDEPLFQATRWTQGGGITPLGFLDTAAPESFARATSADGSVIVGESSTALAENEAFRWTESGGMVGLGFLHPGIEGEFDPMSLAADVSADGSIVVGWSVTEVDGYATGEAVLWSADGDILGLGFSDPEDALTFGSAARAVTGDGSIVVGSSGGRAMIWDAERGMRDLGYVLVNELGLDLGGWVLTEATGISDDGQTIAGIGLNPFGVEEGWIVHLVPEPGGVALAGLALAALAGLRARHRFL